MSELQSLFVLIKFSMYGRGGRKLKINIPPQKIYANSKGGGGHKLEINIPLQKIYANSKGGLIIEGGVMSSEYGNYDVLDWLAIFRFCVL